MQWVGLAWNIVFLVLAILGLASGYYFYVRGKKERKPTYCIKNNWLVTNHKEAVPHLKIRYEGYGEDIPDLSIAQLLFWNAGTLAFRKSDLAKEQQFAVAALNGAKILAATIVCTNNEASRFEIACNRDRDSISIGFDFMGAGDTLHLQIIHTGKSEADLSLNGVVIDAPRLQRISERFVAEVLSARRNFLQVGLHAVSMGIVVATFLLLLWPRNDPNGETPLIVYGAMALPGLFVALFAFGTIVSAGYWFSERPRINHIRRFFNSSSSAS